MRRVALLLMALCASASCVWLGEGEDTDDCAGDGTPLPSGTPEPNLQPDQVAVVASALRFSLTRLAWSFEAPTLGWDTANCVTVTGGDADVDGWPDIASPQNVAVECVRPAYGTTLLASGAWTLFDTDGGTTPGFGHVASNGAVTIDGAGWSGAEWTFDRRSVATTTAGAFAIDSEDRVVVADLMEETSSLRATYSTVAGTWQPGTPLETGVLEVRGDWTAAMGGVNANGGIEIGGSGSLVVVESCPEKIALGEAVFSYATRDDDQPPEECEEPAPRWSLWRLRVTWSACGATSWDQEYAGSLDEDPWDDE